MMTTQQQIESIAQVCHEANRAYCQTLGDESQLEWEWAPNWQKESAITGVNFRLQNPDAPASAQHESWAAQKIADGWKFGPEKDPIAKTHPCLVDYSQLPEAQRKKDALFIAIVDALK